MRILRRTSIIFSIAIIGIMFVMFDVQAAVISPSPQVIDINPDDTFIVDIKLDSERTFINVVESVVSYPTDVLEAVDVTWGGSFLSMWISEPTVDATAGTISFIGGKPNGTMVVDGSIMSITFRAKKTGTAQVKALEDNTSVRLNDGTGAAAPLSIIDGTYTITNPSPFELLITSPTHPSEETWYQEDSFIAEWDVRDGAFYSHTLSVTADAIPDDFVDEPAGRAIYTEIPDGVFYFILRERLPNDEWEVVGRRRVKIDQTDPLPITAQVDNDPDSFGGNYFLAFNTYDATSGVDYYEVEEGDMLTTDAQSPYILHDQERAQELVVRAYDRAGNTTSRSVENMVSEDSDSFIDSNVLIIIGVILLLVAGVFVLFMMKMRHSSREGK